MSNPIEDFFNFGKMFADFMVNVFGSTSLPDILIAFLLMPLLHEVLIKTGCFALQFFQVFGSWYEYLFSYIAALVGIHLGIKIWLAVLHPQWQNLKTVIKLRQAIYKLSDPQQDMVLKLWTEDPIYIHL